MIYIEFSNGKLSPNAASDDMGEPGPTFGPYNAAHVHDGALLGVGGISEVRGGADLFHQVSGHFFYDGVYYADAWMFASVDPKNHKKTKTHQFDKALTEPPKTTGRTDDKEAKKDESAKDEDWKDILKSEMYALKKSSQSEDKYVHELIEDIIKSSDDSPDLILASLDVLTESAASMRTRLTHRVFGVKSSAFSVAAVFSRSRLRLGEERLERLCKFIDTFKFGGILQEYMEGLGEARKVRKAKKK